LWHLTRNSKSIHGPNGTDTDSHGPTDGISACKDQKPRPKSPQMDPKIDE